MKTNRHTSPTKPQCKPAAPPAKQSSPLPLPKWQRQRVKQLAWACRQIEARTDTGETIHAAARVVSMELQRRCPNAVAVRIPTHPASLIRFLYLWRSGGTAALMQRHGQHLSAVPEAQALEFLNWMLGRQTSSFALRWAEFKGRSSQRAKRPDARDSRRFNEWFQKLCQRLARLDAQSGNPP